MTPERWQRIETLFHQALGRSPGKRAEFLRAACPGDAQLRREVEALLAQAGSAERFPTSGGIAFRSPVTESAVTEDNVDGWATGRQIGAYHLVSLIGRGGMGEVYRAKDLKLGREVAIKLLSDPLVSGPDRGARLEREARLLAALNHPHIAAIHGFEEEDPSTGSGQAAVRALVMELVEGDTLAERIARGALPVPDALVFARQIAEAIAAAHEKSIIHRDLKPANIKITPDGVIKVLDFGLAKLGITRPDALRADGEPEGATAAPTVTVDRTREHAILGTVAYMSPEQARGDTVDGRTDLWAFGCVLYEMLTGRPAFQGATVSDTIAGILERQPEPVRQSRSDVPADLVRIVTRCLQKDSHLRYQSATELLVDLKACERRLAARTLPLAALIRRRSLGVAAVVVVLATASGIGWWWIDASRQWWARTTAPAEINRLLDAEDFLGAIRLVEQAERYVADDAELKRLRGVASVQRTVQTDPAGAEVYMRRYGSRDGSWERLGVTPLNAALPREYLRIRVVKAGYQPIEHSTYPGLMAPDGLRLELARAESAPADMVAVPAGRHRVGNLPFVDLDSYWIDRHEVTNAEFKRFAGAGGYRTQTYWKHPFIKDGRTVSWVDAILEFRDPTGRAGASTWELGSFRDGEADLPVTGVSWFEAAAYCEFAGKSLPTIYHWYRAAGVGDSAAEGASDLLKLSNFESDGPIPVGRSQAMGPYGTYDMAGNAKEWAWNQADDRRYIIGGGWDEPRYAFTGPDAQDPLSRSETYGFRCAKYSAPSLQANAPAFLNCPFTQAARNFAAEKPASDELFEAYRAVYAYDHTPLNSTVERVDESHAHWRREKITYDAAYGEERIIAYLDLPRNATPPFQTVIYFPGGDVWGTGIRSESDLQTRWSDFIVRSGRAVLYPVYQNTYERSRPRARGSAALRDEFVQWFKDLGRSIDYLETRPDIDAGRLAFSGLSLGAHRVPVFLALEPRLKAGIILGGGLLMGATMPPDIDTFHFAPRVRAPVLMLNGRHDFFFPLETSQLPLFRGLGTNPAHKRHVVFDSGHVPPRMEMIKEILDWLDRYLGTLRTT